MGGWHKKYVWLNQAEIICHPWPRVVVVLLTYTQTLLRNSENGNRVDALLSSRVQQICNKMWIKRASAPYCAIFLSLNSTSQAFGRMDSIRLVIRCLRVHIPSRRQDNINYLFLLSALQANSGKLYQMPSNSAALPCHSMPVSNTFCLLQWIINIRVHRIT